MVYLWKKNGVVYHHTDLDAAAQLDGLTTAPDMTVSKTDFEAAGGIVRLLDGEIVFGKTDREIADEAARQRMAEIDAIFLQLEQKLVRPMLANINGTETQKDITKRQELAGKIAVLRAEREKLEASLSA